MTAKAEKVIDKIEPVVEETIEVLETLERIPKLRLNGTTRGQQILILTAVAVSGVTVGVSVAGTIIKKRLEAKYEQIARDEIADAKEFYSVVHDKPPLSDLVPSENESLTQATSAFQAYQSGKLPYEAPTVEPVPDTVTQNIFVEGQPMDTAFDYEAEIALRSEAAPYIISKDEYNQQEKDYAQSELTYYEGDDVLADEKGKYIPDADETVGEMNLHRFGHGSGDNNVLYVRNDRLEMDFVVLKSMGEYAKEVLGLRHADRPGSRKVPRYRGDDG